MRSGYVRERMRKWKERKGRIGETGSTKFSPITNDGVSVWVWAKDNEGRICGKQKPREWLKEDDMLVPIDMVNEDLEEEMRRESCLQLFS